MSLLRALAFNMVLYGAAFGLSAYGTVLRRLRPGRLPTLGRLWARIALASLNKICGIRLDIQGLRNLPASGGMIIAAQHQSALDILVWLSLLDHPAYVMKRELQRIPLFGPLLVPAGMIPVNRAGGSAALRHMVQDCRTAAAAGRPIVIFPEGTRAAPGTRVPLQPGIAALAKSLGVPVIPAATDSGKCWARQSFAKRRGTVHLTIHPPLPPSLPRAEILSRLTAYFYE